MTVGVFIDRLEQFRQGVLQYKKLFESGQRLSHTGVGAMEPDELRETLCQQFTFLDESVRTFSRGRYQIFLDARGRQDIYAQAFSKDGRTEHLDLVLSDLEQMLTELNERPRHFPLPSHNQWPDSPETDLQLSFGSLGYLGHSLSPASSATLHSMLNTVACVIQQRVTRPEDREKLLAHVQALIDHPEMTNLLPLPSSKLL